MRQVLVFCAALGSALLSSATRSEVITVVQNPVMNTALMGSPGYFFTQDATVNSWQADGDAQRIDLSFARYKGRLGQNRIAGPYNWSGTNFLTTVIQNTEGYPLRIALMISTKEDQYDFTDGYYAEVELPAESSQRYAFYFSEPPVPDAQMKVLPKPFDGQFVRLNCNLVTNLASIKHWRIVNLSPYGGRIIFSSFRTVRYTLSLTDVVDDFFQYTARPWNTKVHSVADMFADAVAEAADLTLYPSTGERFGTTTLPNQGPSTRWRTARINGKWFLVHPSGRPFWSFGINGVHDMMSTKIAGREQMFTNIPSRTGPNSDLYWTPTAAVGEVYRVVAHNMRLKYPGAVVREKFLEMMDKRLDSWGVNTISASAVPEMYDDTRPYVIIIKTLEFSPHIPTPTTAWSTPPDPYASNFQSWCTQYFSQQLANHNGKSNFMGVFVDNEMSWGHQLPASSLIDRYSVALGVLAAPANQPSKMEFIRVLQRKYRTISRLNSAWRKSYASFNSLNLPVHVTDSSQINSAMGRDLADFNYRFASAYFTKVRAALNAAGCTALYMGCRFWHQVPEILNAAANSVDVMSFNNYAMPVDYNWSLLNSMRKPVLISEWSVNVDEGPTLGPIGGLTRTQRGQLVKDMFQRAMSEPNIVGLHWFELYDQPVTNRGHDIENFGIGVLDVTDAPHQEVVDSFRWAAQNMYVIRR